MTTLVTIYWLCFGIGLVYVLVAGTLGAVSQGLEGAGDVDTDFDLDTDVDFDADVDVDVDAGFDADIDHDAGVEAHHGGSPATEVAHGTHSYAHAMPGYNPLSPLSIMGFLCAFGAAGLIATGLQYSFWLGLAIAVGGGLAMGALLWLFIGKFLFGLQGSSEAHVIDMVGLEAEVLTPVEEDICGEIAYVLEGVRYTAPARLLKEGRVGRREKVRIRKVRGNMVYIEEKRKLLA
ncbi:NfeD family protein [bacterium]|nr:NfeD family protein [bacterium]